MQSDSPRLDKPRALLPSCIPARGGVWADIGCGDGVFTTILQEIVGPSGQVIGVDSDPGALRRLEERFRRDHPTVGCETLASDFTAPLNLPPLDGFVIANALHFVDAEQQGGVMRVLAALLKPGGRAIVVEYNTREAIQAVPHPIDPLRFFRLSTEAGLEDARVVARVPSSFLGEMYAGMAFKPGGIEDGPGGGAGSLR